MTFQDKTIQCADCGSSFTFTAREQEFFQSKGYVNEPKRCPTCRQSRRSQRGGGGGYPSARCIRRYVHNAGKKPKCLSNHEMVGLSTAVSATSKSRANQ